TGSKKRVRWLPARRNFSQPCPSLRIPNRFLREGNRPPPARSGHRCVADNANLYVFGGYNPDFDESGGSENEDYPLFRELWKYHFATGTWQQMRTEGYMPRELASMSAVLHGNNLLVFGGTGIPFGESNGNDVHVCNVKYKRWSLLGCRGKKPNRIYGQAMAIINGYLYVFGGTTGYIYSTDLHRLDLNTREWIHLKPNNPPDDLPEERYRHEITHDGQKIYILGGGTSWTSYPLDKQPAGEGAKKYMANRIRYTTTNAVPIGRAKKHRYFAIVNLRTLWFDDCKCSFQLLGFSEKPLSLQMFIGTADERSLRPHAFYQVHRITGKMVSTASQELVLGGTKILEIPLNPENGMSAR
ncbi:Kelch domain-containing protein 10, partial [Acipenser ruthenus]